MEDTMNKFKNLLDHSISQIDIYLKTSDKLNNSAYRLFNNDLKLQRERLIKLSDYISKIKPFKIGVKPISSIGYKMKHFYEFYKNTEVNVTMNYVFGLNAYFDHINGIKYHINNLNIHKCKISSKTTSFKEAYFAPLHDKAKWVKNDNSLKNNILITGPNAAG